MRCLCAYQYHVVTQFLQQGLLSPATHLEEGRPVKLKLGFVETVCACFTGAFTMNHGKRSLSLGSRVYLSTLVTAVLICSAGAGRSQFENRISARSILRKGEISLL